MDLIHLNHLINFDISNGRLSAKVFKFQGSKEHFEKKHDVYSESSEFGKQSSIVCCKAALCSITNVIQPYVLVQSYKKEKVIFTLCQMTDFKSIRECFSFDKCSFGNSSACGVDQCKMFFISDLCTVLALDTTSGCFYCIRSNDSLKLHDKNSVRQPSLQQHARDSENSLTAVEKKTTPCNNVFLVDESTCSGVEILGFIACVSDPKSWSHSPAFSSEDINTFRQIDLDIFSCGWVAIQLRIDLNKGVQLSVNYSLCKIPPVYSTCTSALLYSEGTTLLGTTAKQIVRVNPNGSVSDCTDLQMEPASKIFTQIHGMDSVVLLCNKRQVCAVDLNTFDVISTWSDVASVCQGDLIVDSSNIASCSLILHETSLRYGSYITKDSYKLVVSKDDCAAESESQESSKRNKPLFNSFEDMDKDLFDSHDIVRKEDNEMYKITCKNLHGIVERKKQELLSLKQVSGQMEEASLLGKMQLQSDNRNIKTNRVDPLVQSSCDDLVDIVTGEVYHEQRSFRYHDQLQFQNMHVYHHRSSIIFVVHLTHKMERQQISSLSLVISSLNSDDSTHAADPVITVHCKYFTTDQLRETTDKRTSISQPPGPASKHSAPSTPRNQYVVTASVSDSPVFSADAVGSHKTPSEYKVSILAHFQQPDASDTEEGQNDDGYFLELPDAFSLSELPSSSLHSLLNSSASESSINQLAVLRTINQVGYVMLLSSDSIDVPWVCKTILSSLSFAAVGNMENVYVCNQYEVLYYCALVKTTMQAKSKASLEISTSSSLGLQVLTTCIKNKLPVSIEVKVPEEETSAEITRCENRLNKLLSATPSSGSQQFELAQRQIETQLELNRLVMTRLMHSTST